MGHKCHNSIIWVCVLNESGTDISECRMNVTNGTKFAGVIRSLQLDCARVLHVILLMSILFHGRDNGMERNR